MPVDAIIEWDVRNWSRCLSFWIPALARLDRETARVLALGERNGGVSLWFALQGFHVICSDFGGPTAKAQSLHREFGVSSLVNYADIDVFAIPFQDASFDIVACKSVIGGLKKEHKDAATRTLANQALAVSEIHRVLKPGGRFVGAENLSGSWMHRLTRRAARGGRVGWRHFKRRELLDLFAEFEAVDMECFGFLGTRNKHFGLDKLTGFADAMLSPMLPKDWLYIAFVRAKKNDNRSR